MDVFSEVPSHELAGDHVSGGVPLLDILCEAGVFKSKGEARRMISSGGLYLNSERVEDAEATFSKDSLLTDSVAVVRKGKKNYYLLKIL